MRACGHTNEGLWRGAPRSSARPLRRRGSTARTALYGTAPRSTGAVRPAQPRGPAASASRSTRPCPPPRHPRPRLRQACACQHAPLLARAEAAPASPALPSAHRALWHQPECALGASTAYQSWHRRVPAGGRHRNYFHTWPSHIRASHTRARGPRDDASPVTTGHRHGSSRGPWPALGHEGRPRHGPHRPSGTGPAGREAARITAVVARGKCLSFTQSPQLRESRLRTPSEEAAS